MILPVEENRLSTHIYIFCLQKHILLKHKNYCKFMTQRSAPAGSQGIWVNSIRYILKNRGTLSTCNINVEIIKRNRVLMRAQKDFHAQIEQGLEPKHVLGWMTGRAINERTTSVPWEVLILCISCRCRSTQKTSAWMFIAALSVIAKSWKQLKCLSIGKWSNSGLSLKWNTNQQQKGMNYWYMQQSGTLKSIMFSEINQT